MVLLSWPVIIAGKKCSRFILTRKITDLFFRRPHNEVISIPISVPVAAPENTLLPRRVLQRLLTMIDDIFIFDECVCRSLMSCSRHPVDIGCMALGPTISQIHSSHGRKVTTEEALHHVERASSAGLVATVAHTWIDSVAFGLTPFKSLIFICYCDDCCCIFRRHMKNPGGNLATAYRRLPGLNIQVDPSLCDGCGRCGELCFLGAIDFENEKPLISDACAGCGRCVEACERGALSITIDDEDTLLDQLVSRIREISDIPLKSHAGHVLTFTKE